MTRIAFFLLIGIVGVSFFAGCKKDVYGCTNRSAYNYNPNANIDNGSCVAKVYGCTDPSSSSYNSSANTDDGSCVYTGNATFWFASNMANATVTINGTSGTITQYYPGSVPGCGAIGCANFTLQVGTYSYTASSSQYSWNGTATITRGGCALFQLQ